MKFVSILLQIALVCTMVCISSCQEESVVSINTIATVDLLFPSPETTVLLVEDTSSVMPTPTSRYVFFLFTSHIFSFCVHLQFNISVSNPDSYSSRGYFIASGFSRITGLVYCGSQPVS